MLGFESVMACFSSWDLQMRGRREPTPELSSHLHTDTWHGNAHTSHTRRSNKLVEIYKTKALPESRALWPDVEVPCNGKTTPNRSKGSRLATGN